MTDKTTIGVILSGAGYLDGAEIQEAVITLLAIDEAGADARICAPHKKLDEVNHITGEATGSQRDVFLESARIARGTISDVADVKGTDLDGWIFPGGYGAAKNLCTFATQGTNATPNREVARIVREALAAHIPIGACCIAPALLATITRTSGPNLTLTIGNDTGTADALRTMGASHVDCEVHEVVISAEHKVVTAPAYMYGDARISQVAEGIRKMVRQVIDWA